MSNYNFNLILLKSVDLESVHLGCKSLGTKKEYIACPSPFFSVVFTQSTSIPFKLL